MKHFLNGVGVAAVIAIAAPALAQASTTSGPSSTGATSVQMAQAAAQSPAAARPQRPARKSQTAKARGGGSAVFGPTSGNNVANELNRMELQRLETGAPPQPIADAAALGCPSTTRTEYEQQYLYPAKLRLGRCRRRTPTRGD